MRNSTHRFVVCSALLGLVACTYAPAPPPPKLCVGGYIEADGGCSAKCDPTKCLAHNTCVNNACALECKSHFDCAAATQRCVAATQDDTDAGVMICADVDLKSNGKQCPLGTECSYPVICRTTGPGDATAYCVGPCLTDNDCPGGFECGTMRDPHEICGSGKGNNNECGLTDDPCSPPVMISADPYLFEGASCLQRRVCLKRTSCSSCTRDADCSLTGMSCRQIGVDFHCVSPCASDADCGALNNCVEGFCTPRYTACKPPPAFCARCRYDRDCESAGLECVALHGDERSCIDLNFAKTCATDNDCPIAPSGMHGTCMGPNQFVDPTSSVYHRCYAPTDANESYSCYPAR